MDKPIIDSFSVKVYGELQPYNEVISKARVRIFYKGLNRNATYISDEFAEKLVNSLPYTPIKGIFSDETHDFTDHGDFRNEGKAYGVVPYPANFAWEDFEDSDGITRTYACADVLLWTGIYEEAKLIPGKAQSMELYGKSLKGEWKYIDGQKCYYFTDGCFLGLEALGENVEPCFEGAQFYSLMEPFMKLAKSFEELSTYAKKTIDSFSRINEPAPQQLDEGEKQMQITFNLSDEDKRYMLMQLLNADKEYFTYAVVSVYDEYAIAYNYETDSFEKVNYTKNNDTDSVELGEREKVFSMYVNEGEKNLLENIRQANGGNFELIDEKLNSLQNLNEKVTELTSDNEELQGELSALKEEKSSMENELNTLKEYKLQIERAEKNELIDKYALKLTDETVQKYREQIDNYSALDLKKELSFELVNNNPDIFTIVKDDGAPVPKIDAPKSGIEEILSKY